MQQFTPLEGLFKGRHFDQEIVVLCVRWYLSFKLSYRDLVAMMAERGIDLAHTTILRWVQHYTPEFEKRWKRFARPVGGSWRALVQFREHTSAASTRQGITRLQPQRHSESIAPQFSVQFGLPCFGLRFPSTSILRQVRAREAHG